MIHIKFPENKFRYMQRCNLCGVEFLDNTKHISCPSCGADDIHTTPGYFSTKVILVADCIHCKKRVYATNPTNGRHCNAPLDFVVEVYMGWEQHSRNGLKCVQCKEVIQNGRYCCGIVHKVIYVREFVAKCERCDAMKWDTVLPIFCCQKQLKEIPCSNT